MESNVYICTWEKAGGKYRLWLKKNSRLKGVDSDFEQAYEKLMDAVRVGCRDDIPIIEFDIPIPSAAKYGKPDLVLLDSENCLHVNNPRTRGRQFVTEREARMEELSKLCFTGGRCKNCGLLRGTRTGKPLEIWVDSENEVDFAGVPFQLLQTVVVISEVFLGVLTKAERTRLKLRRVTNLGKAKKAYYEVLGPPDMRSVGVKGVEKKGWKCKRCAYTWFWHPRTNLGDISDYVAKRDLPNPLPTCFTVQRRPNEIQLCMPRERWRSLLGEKGTKRIMTDQLGVVPDEDVERSPKVNWGWLEASEE